MDEHMRRWVDQCAALAADELRWDGDTVELPNGEELTLHVEQDPDHSVYDEDPEFVGHFAEARVDRWNGDYVQRPSGFDGGAMILRGLNFNPVWWQPPKDMTRDNVLKFRDWVVERLEDGYCIVGVEYRGETAWIGGCDDVYPELVSEQAAEVMWQVLEREQKARAARLATMPAMVGSFH